MDGKGSPSKSTSPSRIRVDGSIRRERKLRPGFIPKEDVPAYVPPGKRAEYSSQYRYKLINGHYEVVPDEGNVELWAEE